VVAVDGTDKVWGGETCQLRSFELAYRLIHPPPLSGTMEFLAILNASPSHAGQGVLLVGE
jgi:hypothetical protein